MRVLLKNFHIWFGILCVFCFAISCNAPRNNPVDPQNPDSRIVMLEGVVYSKPPIVTIAGLKVTWQNQSLSTNTDESGYFEFKNLECNNGWLHFSGDEYSTDSVYINWGLRKEVSVSVYLNSYPKLESVSFYSSIEYSYLVTPTFNMTLNARVTDHDNDIDTVFIENDELKFVHPLDYNVATKYFEDKIYLLDLGLENNSEVIGKDFKITVRDLSGKKYVIGKTYIKRVILNYVQFISPSGQDTTGSRPELKWVRFNPGFPFNYIIQVYRSESTSSILGWQVTCPSSEISATVNLDLPQGRYTWVIWCVDEFGNRSSSKEASFIVGGG